MFRLLTRGYTTAAKKDLFPVTAPLAQFLTAKSNTRQLEIIKNQIHKEVEQGAESFKIDYPISLDLWKQVQMYTWDNKLNLELDIGEEPVYHQVKHPDPTCINKTCDLIANTIIFGDERIHIDTLSNEVVDVLKAKKYTIIKDTGPYFIDWSRCALFLNKW